MTRYTFTIRKLRVLIAISFASCIFTLATLLINPYTSSEYENVGPDGLSQSTTWIKPKELSAYSQRFVINSANSCSSRVTLLAIVVSSHISNFNNRRAIRRTWASQVKLEFRRKVCLFFLTGKAAEKGAQSKLLEEVGKFDDLIQADFLDSNYNQTLRSLAILEWKTLFAPQIQFLMKTEDDVYVNVGKTVEELISRFVSVERVIIGSEVRKKRPPRNKKHVWYVPFSIFSDAFYPAYVKGQAYVLDQKAVDEILAFSRNRLIFFKESVFITGMCRENTKIRLVNHDGFKVFSDLEEIEDARTLVLFAIQRLEMYEIYKLVNEN